MLNSTPMLLEFLRTHFEFLKTDDQSNSDVDILIEKINQNFDLSPAGIKIF